jgi:hypothetical protein
MKALIAIIAHLILCTWWQLIKNSLEKLDQAVIYINVN